MEKRELKDSQEDPVPKQITEEIPPPPTQAPEERKVMFDIGCTDDGENKDCEVSPDADNTDDGSSKERRVAFNIGDSEDNDCSDGKLNKTDFKETLSLSEEINLKCCPSVVINF